MLPQAAIVSQISAFYQVFVRLFPPGASILYAGERWDADRFCGPGSQVC
jgi:hypothetical protein